MQLFAHTGHDHDVTVQPTEGSLGTFIQHPAVAIILTTVIIFGLILGSLYALKRYTTWQFPHNKGGK